MTLPPNSIHGTVRIDLPYALGKVAVYSSPCSNTEITPEMIKNNTKIIPKLVCGHCIVTLPSNSIQGTVRIDLPYALGKVAVYS